MKRKLDERFVSDLAGAVGFGGVITASKVIRLGQMSDGKIRPIKATFLEESEKEKIIANIGNLKGQDEYRGVSITDDYTITERETIKAYKEKAKEMNNNEAVDSKFEWKVRGTPKNGLRIKVWKRRSTEEPGTQT